MFPATLKGVDQFLKSITCNRCLLPNENLQFVGTSCKHVFCWTCINAICYVSFPQCPLCAMPISASEITPAHFLNQLFQLGLKLQENIKKLEGTNIGADKLENLFEPDMQTRTVEEFCATQKNITTVDEVPENYCFESDNNEQQKATAEQGCSNDIWKQGTNDIPVTSVEMQKHVNTPKSRGLKRRIDSPSVCSIGEFRLQAPLPDSFLFSQPSTQTMPVPQMTQQLPVFEEPNTFCFFQQKPKKTFADRIMPKSKTSSPGERKRKSKLSTLRSESPEVF